MGSGFARVCFDVVVVVIRRSRVPIFVASCAIISREADENKSRYIRPSSSVTHQIARLDGFIYSSLARAMAGDNGPGMIDERSVCAILSIDWVFSSTVTEHFN